MVFVAALMFFAWHGRAEAQVNTGGIRGTVKAADDGTKLELVEVTLTHKPSGAVKTTFTNESGAFAFNGLRVGGPYSVRVFMDGFLPQGADGIFLSAGKKENLPFTLPIAGETIEVAGSAASSSTSGRSVFGSETLQELPSIGRDPKDVARLSPDAIIDDSNSDAISIGGANSRFNSVTIDGIRQDDDFGLNNGGYPTQRSPVSLAAIEQISIESSPFDVRFGKFLGGNINVITKTGTNEFHGSIFGAYTGDKFTGSKTGDLRRSGDFIEGRYGLSIGGPIAIDKAHFFLSVEGLSATTPTDIGVLGSGAAIEAGRVTEGDLAQVQDIAERIYGYEAGGPVCDLTRDPSCLTPSLGEDDLKLLLKVDWSINQKHRVSGKYQRTAGNTIRAGSSNFGRLALTSSWYSATDTLSAFTLQLFSDWTDQFSTEVEFSGKIVNNRQRPLNGTDFASMEIETPDEGTIVLGPDVNRHANRLDNNLLHTKLQGNYLLKSHVLTAGWEMDVFDVNNLFVARSLGQAFYNNIADFEARQPVRLIYNNAITQDPRDAAADWGYQSHAFYAQDQFEINPNLTVQGGVRAELYTTGSKVVENTVFEDRYGFSNTATINGKHIFMPRLGVSWRAIPRMNIRGGVGLYGGGTPNVWLSNSYTNDGVRTDEARETDAGTLAGFDGRTIPAATQAKLQAGEGNVDALDPDFALPATWKASLGVDYGFDAPLVGTIGQDFNLGLNYVYSRVHRGVIWRDLRRDDPQFGAGNVPIGTFPDGRSYYDQDSFDTGRGYDILLTNANKGYSHSATASLAKAFDFGLNLSTGYSFQRVKELNPANSATSTSNYGRVAVDDPQNPDLATSNYERAHRLIHTIQYSRPLLSDITNSNSWLVKDLKTSLAVFIESRSGQPFSFTYEGNNSENRFDNRDDALGSLFGEELTFARRNRNLFYVPNGSGDDVVLDGIDQDEFDAFLKATGLEKYRGKVAPRNAFRSPWFHKIDMRFSQDLPSPIPGHKGKFMLDIENVGNLINSDWGRFQQVGFPYVAPIVDVDVDPATGRYVYSNLRNVEDFVRTNIPASIWRIQMTLMYNF